MEIQGNYILFVVHENAAAAAQAFLKALLRRNRRESEHALFVFAFLPVSLILYLVCPRVCKNALLVLISFVFLCMGFSGLSAASAAGNGFQLLCRPGHRQLRRIGAARHKIPSCDRRAVQSAASRLLQIRRICHRNAQRHFAVHAEARRLRRFRSAFPSSPSRTCRIFQTFTTVARPRRKNPLDFCLYVSFFPKMISGPSSSTHSSSRS